MAKGFSVELHKSGPTRPLKFNGQRARFNQRDASAAADVSAVAVDYAPSNSRGEMSWQGRIQWLDRVSPLRLIGRKLLFFFKLCIVDRYRHSYVNTCDAYKVHQFSLPHDYIFTIKLFYGFPRHRLKFRESLTITYKKMNIQLQMRNTFSAITAHSNLLSSGANYSRNDFANREYDDDTECVIQTFHYLASSTVG